MHSEGKILTGLLERRKREAAFKALAQIEDLDQLVAQAAQIAADGAEAIPVLVAMLDTDDPQLRGGLGQVAARLDRDQMVPALLEVARSTQSSDHARLNALTILDRFLGEPVDESLLTGLHDPDQVARQSLKELIHEMRRDRFAIIEYLHQLAKQPPEVTQIILDAVAQVPADPHLITLLRMLVQDDDRTVARAALDRLSRIRLPESISALNALARTLPPTEAALAERGARKLQMSGVSAPACQTPTDHWQALLSPVDGGGAQVIWFVSRPNGKDKNVETLFNIVTQDPIGIVASFRTTKTTEIPLPFRTATGSLHVVSLMEDVPPVVLLTVPFEEARRAVRAALHRNWESGYPTPLLYRLLNPLIWASDALADASLDAASEAALAMDGHGALDAPSGILLDHPFFASWSWPLVEQIENLALSSREMNSADRASAINLLAGQIFGSEMTASYQRRLRAMSRWLEQASDHETASLALAAARQLETRAPAEVPFVRRLMGDGLEVVLSQRAGASEPASPSRE